MFLFFLSFDQITPSDSTWGDIAILIGKMKIKFIRTIFQLQFVFPLILIQLENGPNEFYF